jgi:tetrahydromethanopterin S-methyltransferase subunit G
MEQVEDRLAELSGEHHRVAELEERVDFAERMLAQRQVPAPLPLNRTPS